MIHRGIATFGLDYGKCPKWLFERMTKLGREMIEIIVTEYGPDEFIKRLADPVWFQSLGTVLAFDWNASGLTTVLTGALKEAVRGNEGDFGIFQCGGKGKTSLRTPDEIRRHSEGIGLSRAASESLTYNSKMAAKVDSSLIQDGFQLYHHTFFFSKSGAWTVVQQGMDVSQGTARRYHWHSEEVTDLVCEPHTGITNPQVKSVLNLTASDSAQNRQISTELTQQNYNALMKDIRILRKHSSDLSQSVSLRDARGRQLTLLNLNNREFRYHPVVAEDFSKSRYLDKILYAVCSRKPESYENLLSLQGVGPKTIRALSLVAELLYGAKASYQDPARYSFAHGGKDGTPYFVDRKTYDKTIDFFGKVIDKMRTGISEKKKMQSRLHGLGNMGRILMNSD